MPDKNTVDVTFRRMEPFMSMGRIDAAVTRGLPVGFLPKVGEEFPPTTDQNVQHLGAWKG